MLRRLLYFVPAFATLVAGYALLGPGRGRVLMGARVLVADDASGEVRSARIQVVEHLAGIEEPRAIDGVEALVDDVTVWRGSTGADGIIELVIPNPKEGARSLEVRHGLDALASGPMEPQRTPIAKRSTQVSGKAEGQLTLAVHVPRGQLTPPFPEAVSLSARRADGSPEKGTVRVTVTGGTTSQEIVPLRDGSATVSIAAMVPPVTLDLAVTGDGGTGSWSGELPVSMGSIWVDPRSTSGHVELAVRSPHSEAYVSLYDEQGRVGGLAMPLAVGADGIYRGSADTNTPGSLLAVVATDPQERGLTTVAWPLERPEERNHAGPLRQVLDGIPRAKSREEARLHRVRRITAAFLGAATLLEIALLLIESRRTRRDLTSHFFEASNDLEEPIAEGVTRKVPADGDNDRSKLIVPAKSTALVVITVGLLLALSALTLAALNFTSS